MGGEEVTVWAGLGQRQAQGQHREGSAAKRIRIPFSSEQPPTGVCAQGVKHRKGRGRKRVFMNNCL